MFILTSIAINSSLASKQTHRCSSIMIAASLVVQWDSSNFSSNCSIRISKRYREEEEILVFISLSTCETNFSLQKHYFTNPYTENVCKWVLKLVSKFHNDPPTINESKILVLLGQVWMHAGKRERALCKGHFSHHRHYFSNSNSEDVWK